MNLLERYIARVILIAITLVLAAILSLDTIINFIRFSDDIGQGSFTLINVFEYLGYSLPYRIYVILPFAVLIGAMMGLSYLNANNEILVMRSAGISITRLLLALLKTGLILALLLFLLGEFVVPISEKTAQRERNKALYNNMTLDIKNEVWIRNQNIYTNIRVVQADKTLSEIFIYAFNPDDSLKYSLHAQKAEYKNNHWVLENVRQTRFQEQYLQVEIFPQYIWHIPFSMDLIDIITSSVGNLSVFELAAYINYLQRNQINSKPYQLKFWQKIVAPFTLLIMLVLAFPFSLGHQRQGKLEEKLFFGIIAGLVYYLLNTISGKLSLLFDFPAWLSASWFSMIILLIAMILIKKIL